MTLSPHPDPAAASDNANDRGSIQRPEDAVPPPGREGPIAPAAAVPDPEEPTAAARAAGDLPGHGPGGAVPRFDLGDDVSDVSDDNRTLAQLIHRQPRWLKIVATVGTVMGAIGSVIGTSIAVMGGDSPAPPAPVVNNYYPPGLQPRSPSAGPTGAQTPPPTSARTPPVNDDAPPTGPQARPSPFSTLPPTSPPTTPPTAPSTSPLMNTPTAPPTSPPTTPPTAPSTSPTTTPFSLFPAVENPAVEGVLLGSAAAADALCAEIVHCKDGLAHSDAAFNYPKNQTCEEECDGNCCKGVDACDEGRFSVCADGSCDGDYACNRAGGMAGYGGSVGLISGKSCVGSSSCADAGGYTGSAGDIFGGSCHGEKACHNAGSQDNGSVGDISGGSCHGKQACAYAGHKDGNAGGISDGSCDGEEACYRVGFWSGSVGDISGGSCIGSQACNTAGAVSGTVGAISNGSCVGLKACQSLGLNNGNLGSSLESCCNGDYECQWTGCSSPGQSWIDWLETECPSEITPLPTNCSLYTVNRSA